MPGLRAERLLRGWKATISESSLRFRYFAAFSPRSHGVTENTLGLMRFRWVDGTPCPRVSVVEWAIPRV
jgi:hypothetical protein